MLIAEQLANLLRKGRIGLRQIETLVKEREHRIELPTIPS